MERSVRGGVAAVLLTLALHALAARPASVGDGTTLSGQSEARLDKGGADLYLATRSRAYELTQFAYRGAVRTVVVETEVRHRHRVSEDLAENGDEMGTILLTVHPVSGSGHFDTPLARREIPGDEVKIEGSAGIKVVLWGCCAESDAETQLSLATLKTLYVRSSSMPLLTYTRLGKPSAVGRIVAVYSVITPLDKEVLGGDPSVVALITWASDDGALQRILVRLRGGNPREAAMSWSSTPGWKVGNRPLDNHLVLDPAKPSTPLLVWQIDDARAIEIPMVGDRFDCAAAKLPQDISLQEVTR
jgi:hypothetical protein